jgi:hypothetical protein
MTDTRYRCPAALDGLTMADPAINQCPYDYYARMHADAVRLIGLGKAYVCHLSLEEMRAHRGDLVTPGTALPTPWAKAAYDAKDTAFQKQRGALNDQIAAAMRANAPAAEVDRLKSELETLSLRNAEELGADLDRSPLAGTVGAFEGAGYASKGLYRPSLDCIMFSKGRKPFCAICTRALQQMIDYYGE